MKKLFHLIIILIFVGCSAEGKIEVHNKTNGWLNIDIDGDSYELDEYEYASKTYELSDNIFSSEDKEVNVSGEGLVKWYFSDNYTVEADETEEVNIYADAGAIRVWNNSYYTIVSVYLSPSSDDYWGCDDLSGYLYPGYIHSWRVSPGYWDIKVVDEYGDYSTSLNNYIGTGQIYWFTYYGLKRGLLKNDTNNKFKNKSYIKFEISTQDRIEKYRQLEYLEIDNSQ